ncbi:unnamed protein product [Prunus armeniaca]
MMLQEVHEVTCNLEPIISLYQCLQRKGYYWPEMKKQAAEMQANCPKCATIPSTEESFTISFAKDWRTPYLASFINGVLPTDSKHARKLKKTMKRYLIDGLTLYRKGFNGEPLKCLGESEAQQVIFRIPYKIVTDNGTPFVNKQVSSTLSGYGIKHRRSTPYYPQGNGQVEATNKTLLRILSKMVHEYEGGWSVHLPDALWVYRTSRRSATVSTVNDLECDTKSCSDWRLLDLEALDEKRAEVERRTMLYHKMVAQAYNRTVKPRAFKLGDLVLKVVDHVRRQVSGPSKFAWQWEGPFTVKEVYNSGYYRLVSVKEGTLTDPITGSGSSPTTAKQGKKLFSKPRV